MQIATTVNNDGEKLITGSYNGVTIVTPHTDDKHKTLLGYQSELIALGRMTKENKGQFLAIYDKITELTKPAKSISVVDNCPHLAVDHGGNYYLKSGDVVSSHKIPAKIVARMVKSLEMGIDITPLVKAWTRLLRDTGGRKFTKALGELFADYITTDVVDKRIYDQAISAGYTAEQAAKMSTVPDVSITTEGLLCTYKVVNEEMSKFDTKTGQVIPRYEESYDEETGEKYVALPQIAEERLFLPGVQGKSGDAFFCGTKLGHYVRVGQRHSLESWSQVNCDSSASCVKGLHLGGLRYVKGYQNDSNITVNVFVSPESIGAICGKDDKFAIRCKEYFVSSINTIRDESGNLVIVPNRALYTTDSYAAILDEEFEAYIKQAIADSEEAMAKIKQETDEFIALK